MSVADSARRIPFLRALVRRARLAGRHPLLRRGARRALILAAERDYVLTGGILEPHNPLDFDLLFDAEADAGLRDYVRRATAALVARELHERGVAGAVAEVGVARGDFARLLSSLFPERTLYLFDTFDGFAPDDQDADERIGLPRDPYGNVPATPQLVLSSLPHPERAIAREGRFPDSAGGLEDETFCFAHVDVGLHAATSAALSWLYPRLSPGGYLLVSDYNTSHTPGVRRAVHELSAQTGVAYTPLPDWSGAVVIAVPPTTSA